MQDLKERTKQFAIRIIRMTESITQNKIGTVITNQILRSATSVGANYRAAQRGKSSADFINKLKIVEEELDETIYWLELIEDVGLLKPELLANLKNEGDEILRIIVASIKTARNKV